MGFPDLAKAQAAVQRIFPVIDRSPAIDSSDATGQRLKAVEGTIELKNVTFRYVSVCVYACVETVCVGVSFVCFGGSIRL